MLRQTATGENYPSKVRPVSHQEQVGRNHDTLEELLKHWLGQCLVDPELKSLVDLLHDIEIVAVKQFPIRPVRFHCSGQLSEQDFDQLCQI